MGWDGGKVVTKKKKGEGAVEYPSTKDTGFGIRQPGFLVITMSLLANHLPVRLHVVSSDAYISELFMKRRPMYVTNPS